MLNPTLQFVLNLVKMTPGGPLASELEADLADGKLDIDEGLRLAEIAAKLEESLTPGTEGDCEVNLALAIIPPVRDYLSCKRAADLSKPAAPPDAAPK